MAKKISAKKTTQINESEYKDQLIRKDVELKFLEQHLKYLVSDNYQLDDSLSTYQRCLKMVAELELSKNNNALPLLIGIVIGILITLFTFFIFS